MDDEYKEEDNDYDDDWDDEPDDSLYPDVETLKIIREWPMDKGYKELFHLIVNTWIEDYGEATVYTDKSTMETVLTLITGGWSGNEEIVAAIHANALFQSCCWFSSERGGKYVYKLDNSK